jgi:hypothetical protein
LPKTSTLTAPSIQHNRKGNSIICASFQVNRKRKFLHIPGQTEKGNSINRKKKGNSPHDHRTIISASLPHHHLKETTHNFRAIAKETGALHRNKGNSIMA